MTTTSEAVKRVQRQWVTEIPNDLEPTDHQEEATEISLQLLQKRSPRTASSEKVGGVGRRRLRAAASPESSPFAGGLQLLDARGGSAKGSTSSGGIQPPECPDLETGKPEALFCHYDEIFTTGNRNAASFLWSSFLFNHSASGVLDMETFKKLNNGFCAISGSPIGGESSAEISLKPVPGAFDGEEQTGVMYYCCWPCIR